MRKLVSFFLHYKAIICAISQAGFATYGLIVCIPPPSSSSYLLKVQP